jgi:hypothetical protein
VAFGAEADQSAQDLDAPRRAFQELPPLVRFQPYLPGPILALSAPPDLALAASAAHDQPAYALPVPLRDAGPGIGEPAGLRHEVNEQTGAKRAVLTRQQGRQVRRRRPPRQLSHARHSAPAGCDTQDGGHPASAPNNHPRGILVRANGLPGDSGTDT